MDNLQKFLFLIALMVLLTATFVTLKPVEAQAEITVVSSHISKTHTSINEMVSVGFRFVWTESGEPLTSASVTVDGESYEIFQDGWVLFYSTSSYVRKVTWEVDDVLVSGTYRSFEVETEKPSCIFDCVIVELQSDDNRIGVGQTPEISYEAYYVYENTSFRGIVTLNDTVTSDVVGTGVIGVKNVEDEKYGIKTFEANKVKVIWDSVDVQLFSTKQRYDVGEEPDLTYIAYYEYDKASFEGDIRVSSSASIDTVGKQEVTVSSISDDKYEVSSFTSNTVEVILDQVVVELVITDTRIKVGEQAEVYWSAHYAYDGDSFNGDVRISPNTRRIDVGSNEIMATGVLDKYFGLNSFTTNSIKVIWDRVRVELSVEDVRVNLGETVDVEVDAYYEYDNRGIDRADVHLNRDSMRLTNVGDFTFKVEAVDARFGIDEINADEVTVVWDMVVFEIEEPESRVILGSLSSPHVAATYVYDGRPFRGTYTLNEDFGVEVGSKEYYVSSMAEEGYGLTAFTSNHAEYYFDKVTVQSESSHMIPGSYQTTFEVSYVSDGSPVTDAEVTVGGESCSHLGRGIYKATVPSFFPYVETHATITVGGYAVESVTFSGVMVGNIAAIIGVLGVASLTLNRYMTGEARKAKKIEETRRREETKRRVIQEVNQRSLIVSLDELPVSGEIEPKLRTALIKEALKEGSLDGRLMKKGSQFIHAGSEKKIIRSRLLDDTPQTPKPVPRRVQEKTFGSLWSAMWDDLAEYKPVRNWTKDSGYLGRGDFSARRTEEGIECYLEYSDKVLTVPLDDLKYMYDNWRRYMSGNITRSKLASKSRYTKYTISILHMYEDQIM